MKPMKVVPEVIVVVLCFVFLAAGCQGVKEVQQGPTAPVVAPAPAQPPQPLAAKHRYRYYPDSAVYMDVAKKTFFYHKGEKWVATTLLPPSVHVDWKNYVVVDLDTDKPYQYHAEIAKKYPPRQGKIKEKTQTDQQ